MNLFDIKTIGFGLLLLVLQAPGAGRAQPAPADWELLHRGAAALRVGHPAAAQALLTASGGLHGTPTDDPDLRLTAALLQVQVLQQQGALAAADRTLTTLRPLLAGDGTLQAVADWLLLGLRTASGAPDVGEAAAQLLGCSSGGTASGSRSTSGYPPCTLPTWVTREAELQLGASLAARPEADRRARGLALLRRLGQDASAGSICPRALARLADALGPPEAQLVLRRLAVEFGDRREGQAALARLAPATLTSTELKRRSERLMAARAYKLAEPDLLQLSRVKQERPAALMALALIRMRQRDDYPRALQYLEELTRLRTGSAEQAEAWFRKGIVLGHLHRTDEAVAAMRIVLKLQPRGKHAREAGFQVGRLLHEAGRFREAAQELERFAAQPHADRDMWRWFVGWSHFRAGAYPQARAVFEQLVPSRNLLVGPKALYWIARAHLAEGHPQLAAQSLETLVRRAPDSYYGLLAAGLRQREAARQGPTHSASTEGAAASPTAEAANTPLLPDRPARGLPLPPSPAVWVDLRPLEQEVSEPALRQALRRVRILTAAGLPAWARHEAARVELARGLLRLLGRDRGPAAVDQLQLALEQYGARWAEQAAPRLPWEEQVPWADQELLRRTYPPAYLLLAETAGREYGVSPWWLLAHMLQESRFQAQAKSYVGALGPLQVMPRTGRLIAARIGFPAGEFADETLYEPGVGLRHAAWYLAELRREFPGTLVLALAGYNGGPLLLGQHVRRRLDLPGDVLVEEIGPHESRNYARKVVDHLLRYLALYAPEEERQALARELLPPVRVTPPLGALDF